MINLNSSGFAAVQAEATVAPENTFSISSSNNTRLSAQLQSATPIGCLQRLLAVPFRVRQAPSIPSVRILLLVAKVGGPVELLNAIRICDLPGFDLGVLLGLDLRRPRSSLFRLASAS